MHDFLYMRPGLLMDMFYLYKAQHGLLKKDAGLYDPNEEEHDDE